MKIGCLVNLGIYTVLVLAYHRWLAITLDPPEVWITACVVALIVAGAFGAIYNSFLSARDASAVRDAQAGLPPADGKWSAVVGTIEPLDQPLIAPFSGKPCVICEYEITHTAEVPDGDSTKDTEIADFTGIAMTACAIRSGNESYRLWGFPNLDAISQVTCASPEDRRRAIQYVQTTEWTDCTGMKLFGGARDMWNALTEAQESFRHDWRKIDLSKCGWIDRPATKAPPVLDDDGDEDDENDDDPDGPSSSAAKAAGPPPIYDPHFSEKRVAPGESVVALGRYFAESGGLVSTVSQNGHMICLYRGDVAAIAKELGGSRVRRLLGGVIALIVVHAALLMALKLYSVSDDTRRKWQNEFREAVRKPDPAIVERMLRRGVSVDFAIDEEGHTPLMETADAAIARLLIERGANVDVTNNHGETALMIAAHNHKIDILKLLIEKGAKLDLKDNRYYTTALMNAISAEDQEAVALLRQAGAIDDTVTAVNGSRITEKDEPFLVCREYIRAIHAADAPRLRELSSSERPARFDDVDWDAYQGARPVKPELVQGFVREDDATVTVTGTAPKGFSTTWTFQIRREDGNWRIAREHWVVKGIPE